MRMRIVTKYVLLEVIISISAKIYSTILGQRYKCNTTEKRNFIVKYSLEFLNVLLLISIFI